MLLNFFFLADPRRLCSVLGMGPKVSMYEASGHQASTPPPLTLTIFQVYSSVALRTHTLCNHPVI